MAPKLMVYESQAGPCVLVSGLPLGVGAEWVRQSEQVRQAWELVKALPQVTRIMSTSVAGSDSVYVWYR